MSIGKNLKELREYLGVSQKDFALKLSITPPSLARYESDKVTPCSDFLSNIHKSFNLNLNWLVCNHGDMFVTPEPDHQKIADTFFDQILEHHKNKTNSLPFAKKVLKFAGRSRHKFILALDEVLDFLLREDFKNVSELVTYTRNNISLVTKATSKEEIELLIEFIENLEQEEFEFMNQNAQALKKGIENSYSTFFQKGDLKIDRVLRKL